MVLHLKLASHAAPQSWRKPLLPASRHNEASEKSSLVGERPAFRFGGVPISDDRLTSAPGVRSAQTPEAIDDARIRGILAVEMEAAALYAFAAATGVRVLCLAHVTNTMGQTGADFEKGEADGTRDALAVLGGVITAIHAS